MSPFFKRAGACLLSLLCLLAGGCFYQGYSSYQTLGLSDEKGQAAGLEPETNPEPACPEGYWMYDGRLFEQQAPPEGEGWQPYLLVRQCREIYGYDLLSGPL